MYYLCTVIMKRSTTTTKRMTMEVKDFEGIIYAIESSIMDELGITTQFEARECSDGNFLLEDKETHFKKTWESGMQNKFFKLKQGLVGRVYENAPTVVVDVYTLYTCIDEYSGREREHELILGTYTFEQRWALTRQEMHEM